MNVLKDTDLRRIVEQSQSVIHQDPLLNRFEIRLQNRDMQSNVVKVVRAIADLSADYSTIGVGRLGQAHLLQGIIENVLIMFGDPRGVQPEGYELEPAEDSDRDRPAKPAGQGSGSGATDKVKCPKCGHHFVP